MKSEAFLRAVGQIDDDLILEAADAPVRRAPAWIRPLSAVAACAVIAVGLLAAVPLLWRTGSDKAMEMAPAADEEICDGLFDQAVGNTSSSKTDGSTSTAGNPSSPTEIAPDTGEGVRVTWWDFRICENGVWHHERVDYPHGLPPMQTLVSDYLAAAGSQVRCVSATRSVVGEKDEVIGGIVKHTVGVTTWTITLDGDPGEDIRRGLTNTVLSSGSPSSLYQVIIRTPEKEYPAHGAYSEK